MKLQTKRQLKHDEGHMFIQYQKSTGTAPEGTGMKCYSSERKKKLHWLCITSLRVDYTADDKLTMHMVIKAQLSLASLSAIFIYPHKYVTIMIHS